MPLPAVGLSWGRTGRQSTEVPPKSCMKTGNREKLPTADGSNVRRQTLAPICTPVNRPAADKAAVGCTTKLSGVDFLHQKHPSICGRTGLSRPTLQNVYDLPTGTQLSKRSKVASEPLLGRTKLEERPTVTPEKCSGVFGSFAKDVLSSSDEDEFYRQYLTDQSSSNGLSHSQNCLSKFNIKDEKYVRRSMSTKMSHRELELMNYQQALLEQMMSPTDPEDCSDLKSMTGKRSDKKNSKKGKDKNRVIQSPTCQPSPESRHKFDDLPLLRQTRLRVSIDPDSAVPEEAQYVPTPPGFEKIPCRPISRSRQVRFNTEERGVH